MLTLTQFKTYANYPFVLTSNEDAYIVYLLTQINDIIQQEIGVLFSLVSVNSLQANPDLQYMDFPGNNLDYVTGIGAWQKTGLVVKLGAYPFNNLNTLQTLLIDQNYRLVRFKERILSGYPNPVIGIRLINQKLYPNQFLRLTGTYGWSNGMPADLENLFYEIIKTKFEYNRNMSISGGAGFSTGLRSLTLSESYSFSPELIKRSRELAFDPANNPDVNRIINNYKQYTIKSVRIS
jgi:hypothetical protein